MSAQRILHVRSNDCLYDPISGNWTVNIPEGIAVNADEEVVIEVINVAVPYSFYNINQTNRFLDIIESELDGSNPVSYTLSMPIGNYNVLQFVSMLQALLTSTSASIGKTFTYTVSYDRFLNKATYSITTSNAKTIFLVQSGINEAINAQYLLGFTLNDQTITSSTPLVSDSTMNMSPYDAIYIHSNLGITNSYDTKTKNLSNILIKIPITSLPFSYIQWENQQLLTYISYRTTIQTIELSIKDMDGFNLDLNNGNWYMSIKFIIRPKKEAFQPIRPDELINLEL